MAREKYERDPYREDWERERNRESGRGREDWGGESREYRSGRGEYGRGVSSYGRGREEQDYRQNRDYQGTLRAGSDYGWRDEDRYQERSERDSGERDYGGGYGAESYGGAYGSREYGGGRNRGGRSREYGGSGGGYGYGGSGGYAGRGETGYTGPYNRDDSRDYQSRNWSGGTPGGYGNQDYGRREQYGQRGGRGWWDKAGDEVSSWFGDDEAQRRREMDRRRGRGPKNYARSDERIREDVCDRLTDDPLIDASEIEVQVNNQEVTLTGTVDSRNERRLAEECVESISGVKHVQNNLRVNERNWQRGESSTSGAATTGRASGSTTTM